MRDRKEGGGEDIRGEYEYRDTIKMKIRIVDAEK